jgi:hypothetical protein
MIEISTETESSKTRAIVAHFEQKRGMELTFSEMPESLTNVLNRWAIRAKGCKTTDSHGFISGPALITRDQRASRCCTAKNGEWTTLGRHKRQLESFTAHFNWPKY